MWNICHKSGRVLFTTNDERTAMNRAKYGWMVEKVDQSREQFEIEYNRISSVKIQPTFRNGDSYIPVQIQKAWSMWQLSRINHDSMAIQNMKDIAHCFSDLRRFIEMKWPTIADLPSVEGVLLNGPENKHEVDALIAALNRVADFYEGEQPVVELPKRYDIEEMSRNPFESYRCIELNPDGDYLKCDEVIEVLTRAGITVNQS